MRINYKVLKDNTNISMNSDKTIITITQKQFDPNTGNALPDKISNHEVSRIIMEKQMKERELLRAQSMIESIQSELDDITQVLTNIEALNSNEKTDTPVDNEKQIEPNKTKKSKKTDV